MASSMSVGAGVDTGRIKQWIGTLPGPSKWTDQATVSVLRIIYELNVVSLLQCKRQRNQKTFMTVQERLSQLGYFMSWQQIRCHWKNLKTRYYHEHRVSQTGQRSTWKHFDVMDSLLRQRTGAAEQGGGDAFVIDMEDSSGAENYPAVENGEMSNPPNSTEELIENGSYGPRKDLYILFTSGTSEETLEAPLAPPLCPVVTDSLVTLDVPAETPVLEIKKEITDEDPPEVAVRQHHPDSLDVVRNTQDRGPFLPWAGSVTGAVQPSPSTSSSCTSPLPAAASAPNVSPPRSGDAQASRTTADSGHPEAGSSYCRSPKRTSSFSWSASSVADRERRRAELELDILLATKRKLDAETFKTEAEERKVAAETLLLAESLKKCDEDRRKAAAKIALLQQETRRSEEETRKAAAIADFHVEERRKAAAKVDVLLEHRNYYMEQRKTEAIKRRMLLLEVQNMRREVKLIR